MPGARTEWPLDTIDTDRPSPEPTPEAVTILTETRGHVRSSTNALSCRSRTVINALYYEPRGSYADVARDTGMPIGSIGPTRLRAMRYLRHCLSDLSP